MWFQWSMQIWENKAKDGDFGSNSALWYGQWSMADKQKWIN